METSPTRSSDQKFCYACAKPLHISAAMCPGCGAGQQALPAVTPAPEAASKPPQALMANQCYCRGCGHAIHVTAPACPKCGALQTPATATVGLRSRVVAALLAFFLGGFGAHKFYCGKTGLGFLYLIFFWTWIPMLIALVEGILYLTGSDTDEEFTRKYCS